MGQKKGNGSGRKEDKEEDLMAAAFQGSSRVDSDNKSAQRISDAEEWLEKGINLYNLGDKRGSIKCYDKAIRLNPNYADAYNNKGACFYVLEDHRGAIKCYDQAIKFNSNHTAAYNNKGVCFWNLGDKLGAIKYFEEAIRVNPNQADAYYNKGSSLQALGDSEGAVKCFDKAIELDPNYADAYNNKGSSLQALGDSAGAIKCFDKAIELDPEDATAYNNKGSCLSSLGDKLRAIKCFDKAIKLNPNQETLYNNKGVRLSSLGDKAGAINCYDQAITLNPSYVVAYYNKGISLSFLGDTAGAIKCFDKVIKLNPNYAGAYFSKGMCLSDLGNKAEALECLDQCIKLDPNQAEGYFGKGVCLSSLGDQEEAIKSYDKAIKLDPNHADAYCGKANALSSLGNKEEALEYLDQSIKLDPNEADFYFLKGTYMDILGNSEGALKCYDETIRLDPNRALSYFIKGTTLCNLGKEDEALECFNKAALLAQSGNWGTNLSEGNKKSINRIINEGKANLINKPVEFASIKFDPLAITNINQESVTQFGKLKKQTSILRDKKGKLSEKELINDTGDNFHPKNNILVQVATILKRLEEIEYKLEKADKIEMHHLKTQLSHVHKVNDFEELKSSNQMKEINLHSNLKDYYKAFVGTFSQYYTTSQSVLSGRLSLDTRNVKVTGIAHALSLIPLFGYVAKVCVQTVSDLITSAILKKSSGKITDIAPNHTEFDKIIQKVAREVTLHPDKKPLLLDDQVEKITSSWIKSLAQKLGVHVNEKLFGAKYKTPVAKFGHKDACRLIDLYISGKLPKVSGASLEERLIIGVITASTTNQG